jgi:sulfhydrogenase subunit alpha
VSHTHDRRIDVEALARVEGEGAMHVRVTGGHVDHVELRIYEPPRYFESILRGRSHLEPPDITARICGICPVAYQLSACNAIEDACGVTVPDPIRQLRRLLYCGEWIESHVLHVFLLHAPDFLGYASALDMAADHRDLVETALRLRKLGNTILEVIGGRAIHPVNVRLGGFHRAPTRGELDALRGELEWAVDAAVGATRLVAGFDFPELVQDHVHVALRPDPATWPSGRPATRSRAAGSSPRSASTCRCRPGRSTSTRSTCPTRPPCTGA